jgi:hypothetical protein
MYTADRLRRRGFWLEYASMDLGSHARPEQPVPGLAVAAAALLVMPLLALAKRRTGQALDNRA